MQQSYGGRTSLGVASLDLRAPVVVVDGSVLEQRGEDEHETHDQVDVDRFDVRNARQCRSHTGTVVVIVSTVVMPAAITVQEAQLSPRDRAMRRVS